MTFSSQQNLIFMDPFASDNNNMVQAAAAVAATTYAQQQPQLQQFQQQSIHNATAILSGAGATDAYFSGNPSTAAAVAAAVAAGSLYHPNSMGTMAVDLQQQQQQQMQVATSPHLQLGGPHQIAVPLGTAATLSATPTISAASTGGAIGERRRSPSSRSTPTIDHAQRRATHNAIERARRESLNGQFQDLASAVPSLIHVRRPSKATIVEKSLDYIRSFKDHLSNRDQYIKKLQLRNLALHDEVNRLRKKLGMDPIIETGLEQYDSLPRPEDILSGNADEFFLTGTGRSASGSPMKSIAAQGGHSGIARRVQPESSRPDLRVDTTASGMRSRTNGSEGSSPGGPSPSSAPILPHTTSPSSSDTALHHRSSSSVTTFHAVPQPALAPRTTSQTSAISQAAIAAAATAAAAAAGLDISAMGDMGFSQQSMPVLMTTMPLATTTELIQNAVMSGAAWGGPDVTGMGISKHATACSISSDSSSPAGLGGIDYAKLNQVLSISNTGTNTTAAMAAESALVANSSAEDLSDTPLSTLTGMCSQFTSAAQ